MINANELRIGNLVYFNGNHNHIGTISGVNKSILKYYCIEYEKELKVFLNNRYDITYSPLNLKPIPLTEEWLLKFGFKKDILVDLYRLHNQFGSIIYYPSTSVEKTKINFMLTGACFMNNTIINVHQLQNLYFALTGSELTVA